jgi:predicted nuclease with RNAse H fold
MFQNFDKECFANAFRLLPLAMPMNGLRRNGDA